MSSLLQDELQELAEYRASGLTPKEVLALVKYFRKTTDKTVGMTIQVTGRKKRNEH